MDKTTKFYGIKELNWKFSRSEIEDMLRDYLAHKEEIKSNNDYSLRFDWIYGEHDEINGVIVIKSFTQEKKEGDA